ncbi:hypothetical protein [Agromyces subbeticus]|uniref:hypothetical protein n=1 Tax=Agromyces subbeticus TaxID=293890 RepID=UPI0003B39967|nr:hypothetical protein [Agromyces subbeticus]
MSARHARDLGLQTALQMRLRVLPAVFALVVGGAASWLVGGGLFGLFLTVLGTLLVLRFSLLVAARRGERAVTDRTRRLIAGQPDHVVFSARGDVTAVGEILRFRSSETVLELDGRWTVEATPSVLRIWCGVLEDAVAVEWPWNAIRTINLARDGRPASKAGRLQPVLSLGVKQGERAATVGLTVVRTGSWQGAAAPFERWIEVRDGLRELRNRARAREDQSAST